MSTNFESVLTGESLCAGQALKQGLYQDGWIVLLQAVMAFMHW